ncbi:MAG: hypothetical protein VX403_03625, partial [Planctomycetota bacterium]|nr:hypothetical protein [Planctomycetota bacterium]
PPPGWRRAVVSALVGPGIALALSATAAVVLLIFTDGSMRPRPFSPFSGLFAPAVAASPWLEAVYILGAVAAIVAGANLLPAPPFRGRILLEALLRPQMGTGAARRATYGIAVAVTITILVIGLVGLWVPPVVVAVMCGAALRREREQTQVRRAVVAGDHWPPEPELPDPVDGQESLFDLRTDAILEQQEAEESARAREGEEIELDRILRKIASEGIDSLDSREQAILQRATDRRRRDP